MCGIWGYAGNIGAEQTTLAHDFLTNLAIASEARGTDSTGFSARFDSGHVIVDKMPYRAGIYSQMSPRFWLLRKKMPSTLIGHTRLGSGSSPLINNNNHPFVGSRYHLVHNGVIPSWRDLKTTHQVDLESETDSELIIRIVEKKMAEKKQLSSSVEWLLDNIWGNMACALLDLNSPQIFLFRNDNPILVFHVPGGIFGSDGVIFFASTDDIFESAWRATFRNKSYKKLKVTSSFLFDNQMYMISSRAHPTSTPGRMAKFMVYELNVKRKFSKSKSYGYTGYQGASDYNYSSHTSTTSEDYWSYIPNPDNPIFGARLDKETSEKICKRLQDKDGGQKVRVDSLTLTEHYEYRQWCDDILGIEKSVLGFEEEKVEQN
jgi:glucosamine 6-phosphate synthetase-like amidotransferase/phosphosugar isomerase protein